MRSATVLICTSAVLCGCGSDNDGGVVAPNGPASVTLTISTTAVMTSAGDTRSLTALVKDANQSVVPSPSLVWSTSAPTVATVSGSGTTATITAVSDGVAIISAASGGVKGTVTVNVHRVVNSVVVASPVTTITAGSTLQLKATALDARQNPINGLTGFTYASSNPNSLLVSSSGLVTALFGFSASPKAVITATVTSDGITASGSTELSVGVPLTFDFAALLLSEYEVPKVPTSGLGIAYFAREGDKVTYTITWSALSGPATGVHIHGPGSGTEIAGTLVDFAPNAQTTNYGSVTGSFTAADIRSQNGRPPISLDSLSALMGSEKAYVDVHTASYAAGEVRGQISGPFR